MATSASEAMVKYKPATKNLYERAETLMEGDSAAARIIISIAVGGTTALTGVASVAGLATAIAEREFLFGAAAVIGTLVGGIWRMATRGPAGALGATVRQMKQQTKSAYREAIANAGLCAKEPKSV